MQTKELSKDEKIEKQITPHPLSYLGYYILGGILTLSAFITVFAPLIGIPLIIIAELIRRGNKYYITDKRVTHEFTFIIKKTSSAPYDKIQDLHLTQGLLERMFDLGTIHINTAGAPTIEIKLSGIQNPSIAKELIKGHMIKK